VCIAVGLCVGLSVCDDGVVGRLVGFTIGFLDGIPSCLVLG
jgi:hypothetical protein